MDVSLGQRLAQITENAVIEHLLFSVTIELKYYGCQSDL